jgi:UDP-N-acetylglucosamine 2-epimerase (non-hydrolysing)
MKKIVHLVASCRPNFMKIAPLYHALKATDWCDPVVIQVPQHTDDNMSGAFLRELGVPIWSVVHTVGLYLAGGLPDAVVIPGDVNASTDYAVAAARAGVPVVHLEAGLRSFDRSMPEEINRIVIDSVSDLLWTTERTGTQNLAYERAHGAIDEIGNIMLDTFEMLRPQIENRRTYERLGIYEKYAVATFHRPSNVDDAYSLSPILTNLRRASMELPIVLPLHPRTRARCEEFAYIDELMSEPRILVVDPLGYVDFMSLVMGSTLVITDSGGVQEETSYLGIPCATVRKNTERPITITHGTNVLGTSDDMRVWARTALAGEWLKGKPIPLWDGKTAPRAVASLKEFLNV